VGAVGPRARYVCMHGGMRAFGSVLLSMTTPPSSPVVYTVDLPHPSLPPTPLTQTDTLWIQDFPITGADAGTTTAGHRSPSAIEKAAVDQGQLFRRILCQWTEALFTAMGTNAPLQGNLEACIEGVCFTGPKGTLLPSIPTQSQLFIGCNGLFALGNALRLEGWPEEEEEARNQPIVASTPAYGSVTDKVWDLELVSAGTGRGDHGGKPEMARLVPTLATAVGCVFVLESWTCCFSQSRLCQSIDDTLFPPPPFTHTHTHAAQQVGPNRYRVPQPQLQRLQERPQGDAGAEA
jgi:hypothetical protein